MLYKSSWNRNNYSLIQLYPESNYSPLYYVVVKCIIKCSLFYFIFCLQKRRQTGKRLNSTVCGNCQMPMILKQSSLFLSCLSLTTEVSSYCFISLSWYCQFSWRQKIAPCPAQVQCTNVTKTLSITFASLAKQ